MHATDEPRPSRASHGRGLAALAIFLIALMVRVGTTHVFQGLDAPPDNEANPDQVDYEASAWSLAEGRGYTRLTGELTAARPPGASFALMPVYLVFGRSFLAGRLWWCVLSAATCVLVMLLGWRLGGRTTGWLAGLALSAYPGHFYYSMHFLSEPIYGLLTIAWLLASLRAFDSRALAMHVLAGACLALAVLTRPQAMLMLAAAGTAFLVANRRRPMIAAFLVQGLVLAVLIVPWMQRNERVMGEFTITTIGGVTFWGAHNAVITSDPLRIGSWMPIDDLVDAEHPYEGDEAQRQRLAYRHAMEFLDTYWTQVPALALHKLWRLVSPFEPTTNRVVYWTFAAAWAVMLPLLLLGLVHAWRTDRFVLAWLAAPLLATVAAALLYYGSIRFRDAAAPVFVTIAMWPVGHLVDRMRRTRRAA